MSTMKSESAYNSGASAYGLHHFVRGHKPHRCNASCLDLVPDNHGMGKCYSHDQPDVLDAEIKLLSDSCVNENARSIGENQLIEKYCTTCFQSDSAFSSNNPSKQFYSHAKNDQDSWLQELISTIDDDFQMASVSQDMEEPWLANAHLMDLDSCNPLVFKRPKKLCSDVASDWIGLKNIEPWWHAADKDDLQFLVSQRSSNHTRHCDFAKVKTMHVEKVSNDHVNCLEVKEQMANEETKAIHAADCAQESFTSMTDAKIPHMANRRQGKLASLLSVDKSLAKPGIRDCIQQGSDGALSKHGFSSAKVNSSNTQENACGYLSKAQLLEALCHSQTRAREAEKLAQEACDEKEHVINLFFRQASYLFAYRQWLRILQLETLCIQLRSQKKPGSLNSPSFFPRVHCKGMVLRKNRHNTAKKKPCKQECNISKCAIAFALGLSLAGAGLFAGWTMGWLFPAFM